MLRVWREKVFETQPGQFRKFLPPPRKGLQRLDCKTTPVQFTVVTQEGGGAVGIHRTQA